MKTSTTPVRLNAPALLAVLGIVPQEAPKELVHTALRAISPRQVAYIEGQGRAIHQPVQFVFNYQLFGGFKVFEAAQRDWVFLGVGEDPLYQDRDKFPIPRAVQTKLKKLDAAGVYFDAIYVAHEVKKGAVQRNRPLDPVAITPPDSKPVAKMSKKFGESAVPLWRTAVFPLRAAGAAAIGAIAVAGAATALAGGAFAGLDPILFGVRVPAGHPVAVGVSADWFYLAHWVYGEED